MSQHKKPAAGSGFQRASDPPFPPPRGTLNFGWYRLDSGWKCIMVCSAFEDHGRHGLVHHISISKSLIGELMKAGNYPADVQHAVEAFGMQAATEDNSDSNGTAHHFWLPVEADKVN